jgi:hypothetical protein
MTLKEKLMKESWEHEFPVSNLQADNIIKIADEFAIEFAEWSTHYIDKNTNIYGDMLHAKSIYSDTYITKELLEIFKKEKGL